MAEIFKGVKAIPVLGAVLVLLLLLAGICFYVAQQPAAGDGAAGAGPERLRSEVASIPGDAMAAVGGDAAAFDRLNDTATAIRGASEAGVREVASLLEGLLSRRDAILSAHSAADDVVAAAGELDATLGELSATAPASALVPLDEARAETAEVAAGIRLLLSGSVATDEAADLLGDHELRLGQIVMALAGRDPAEGVRALRTPGSEAQIARMVESYKQLNQGVLAGIAGAIAVDNGRESAATLLERSVAVSATLAQAAGRSAAPPRLGPLNFGSPWLALGLLAAAAVVALLMVALSFSRADDRRVAEVQASQNERNQAAILRLLDELGSLADGDLTVEATVTEDITGAIADSINYAIEALRELVTTINETGIRIDEAARQTRATAGHLAQASETQSKQVADATESIARMAASIEAVSGDAERSADVARHSVDVAHKGGDAVRRTIEGMNTIRDTIRDTAKRIKRLGESSQEIGNIVELINDIAEQTNILALNASIQASMAGEAGRGFAVVADEVQRLAERSANATKQIEVLVNTIQSDTNEAVVSMERSTTDVVGGALLAENAGAALDEIESVSNQIASLVQNISSTSREQATAATDMTRNMGVLREVSSQTAEATSATSDSIEKLAELAAQLRSSVAGFRLPETPVRKAVPAPERSPEPVPAGPDLRSVGS
jgi:twitching motility protein PilJ